MKKRACLVLGSCLVLQTVSARTIASAPMALSDSSDASSFGLSGTRGIASVPLYHLRQSHELLGRSNLFETAYKQAPRASQNLELALFIHGRVHDLLPESYQGDSAKIAQALIVTANRYKMDPMLLMALIKHESRFNPEVVGMHGEIGLMQIKPSTARWLIEQGDVINHDGETMNVALKDPVTNITFGAAYLARLQRTFRGRGSLYLAAYNMGALNLKNRLRDGQRPRIYSDRILTEYVGFNLDFMNVNARSTSVARLSQTFAL